MVSCLLASAGHAAHAWRLTAARKSSPKGACLLNVMQTWMTICLPIPGQLCPALQGVTLCSQSQIDSDCLQRDLNLSKQQRADLNAARREYLAELGTNIKERQEVLDILHECLPSGSGGKQTAARWAPRCLSWVLHSYSCTLCCKYPARVPVSGKAG